MLTLTCLRPIRVDKGVTRPVLSSVTGISEQRLRDLDLNTHEPWFDEACLIARALCTEGITPLITSGSLTSCDLGPATQSDTTLWRSGRRSPLSLACRAAIAFGLDDPADLTQGSLPRQIWEVIEANERHPDGLGWCPWCGVDRFPTDEGQADHLPTCLPNNIWSTAALPQDAEEARPAAMPQTVKTRTKGIPARNLRPHRLGQDASQKSIALVLGIHPNYYARIERGDVPLTIEHADVLARYYGVDRALLWAAADV